MRIWITPRLERLNGAERADGGNSTRPHPVELTIIYKGETMWYGPS